MNRWYVMWVLILVAVALFGFLMWKLSVETEEIK